MVYISKEPEVETLDLTEELISEGKTVVVSIIEKETGTLRLSKLRSTSVLVRSTFGVPEPTENEIPVKKEELEAVIVPMLAFDRSGARL
jgi:5-formyltetrahydrofolate cyclo-ligase